MNPKLRKLLSEWRDFVARMGILVAVSILFAGFVHAQGAAVRFAVIGDYGMAGPAEAAVAALVKGWSPEFIITVGDNNYENGEAATIDQNIGQYFHEYICPYRGSFGPQVAGCQNRFFPTLGNHDWRAVGALPYLDYFTLPGNERYYEVVRGPVHLFAVDSDPFEPHGVLPGTAQAAWLQAALGTSAAPWKLVYFHHAPYSSGTSSPWMRWPFGSWGASVVLAGHYHNYERLTVGGLTYIVNGLGGATIYGSGTAISGSQVRFDKDYGAMLVEADAEQMTLEFYTRAGILIDVAVLHTGAGVAPTLRFEPATVTGGTSVVGTIVLDGPAPAGGTYVTLDTDLPSVLAVPPGIVVPAGASSIDFPVQTKATPIPAAASIAAGFAQAVKRAAITVLPPALNSVSLAATSGVGGMPASGSVTLTGPAPEGGLTVLLSSNHTAASAPPSVSVPGSAASASFDINTTSVIQDTVVTITAAQGYVTKSRTLTLTPLLKSLSLNPTATTGGAVAKGTVTLNAAAREGGVIVSLASAGPQAITPGSMTIPAGATSAKFDIATVPVAVDVSVPISAAVDDVTRSANLAVKAPVVSAWSLSPTSVSGGASTLGTVTLTGIAPQGGLNVTLTSANSAVVAVPATLAVPAGAKSASVPIATSSVTADTAVVLTAGLNGVSKSTTLTVKVPVVASFYLTSTSVTGGSTTKATVTLGSPAPPGGISVALASSNPAAASLPASLSVAAGASSASVTVSSVAVAVDTPVSLTATLNGVSKTTTLTVKAPVLSAVTLGTSSVTGGSTTSATVTLSGVAPAGGVTVTLSSGNTGVATLPASVTVVAGAKTGRVTVSTVPVTVDNAVALTATLGGISKSTTLTVKAPVVSALAPSSSSVTGGGSVSVTVTLSGVAPAGGVTVALSSANPAVAALPGYVDMAAGSKSAKVTVTTFAVTLDTSVVLTATLNGAGKSTTVTVKAPVP